MTVITRRLLGVLVGLMLLAVVAVGLLHTPAGQRWVLSRVVRAADEYGVTLQVGSFAFNLLRLDAEATGLVLARPDAVETPFLTADRLAVDLPWSALTGPWTLTSFDLDHPVVTLRQAADAGWNLPTIADADSGAPSGSLPAIGRLTISDLSVTVNSPAFDAEAPAIDLRLGRASADGEAEDALAGTVRLGVAARVRWEDRRTTVERLDADVALDGGGLTLRSFEVALPEATISGNGRLDGFPPGAEGIALPYEIDLTLDRAAQWWQPGLELGGRARVAGRVTGTIARPTVTATIEADAVRWAEVDLSVDAELEKDGDAVRIARSRAALGDSAVTASGELSLTDATRPNALRLAWQAVDTVTLAEAVALDLDVVPAALVSGTAEASWTEWRPGLVDVSATVESRPRPGRQDRLPVDGRIEFSAGRDGLRAELDELAIPGATVSGSLDGRWPATGEGASAPVLQGAVQVAFTDLAATAAALDVPGLIATPTTPGLSGTALATVTLGGTVEALEASGRIHDAVLGYRGIDDIRVDATFTARPTLMTIDTLDATIGPNSLSGRLEFDVPNDTLDGRVEVAFPDVAALAAALPPPLAPTGRLEARATISGSPRNPQIDADLDGRNLALGGRPLDTVTAQARLAEGILSLNRLSAQPAGGQLEASGTYRLEDGRYDLTVSGRGLSLASLAAAEASEAGLAGTATFDLSGEGTLAEPTATGRATIDEIAWQGRRLGRAALDLQLTPDGLAVDLGLPALNTTARGTIGLAPDATFDVTADVSRAPLARMIVPGDRADLQRVEGYVSGRLTATGRRDDWTGSRIRAALSELDGRIGPTRLQLLDAGTVDYVDGAVATEGLALLLDDTRLTLAGTLDDGPDSRFTATLTGDLSDLESLVDVAGPGAEWPALALGGTLESRVTVTGSFREPSLSAEAVIRDGRIALGEMPPLLDLNATVRADGRSIQLDSVSATWQDVRLAGEGRGGAASLGALLPGWLVSPAASTDPDRFTLTADGITPAVLSPFLDPALLGRLAPDGRGAARLDLETNGATLADIRARVTLTEARLTAGGIPLQQREPTVLDLVGGELRITTWSWSGADNEITLGGTVDLNAADPRLNLTANGHGDLRLLGVLADLVTTGGRAQADVRVGGSLRQPAVQGTVTVEEGEVRVAEPALLVGGLNGTIHFDERRAYTLDLAGLANGGSVTLDAEVDWSDGSLSGLATLNGRDLALEVPEGLRTETDAALALALTDDQVVLSGTLTVHRGDYRQTLALTTGLLAALQEGQGVTIAGGDDDSPTSELQLNVRVVTEEDIVVDNNYARGAVGADLRVTGTAGAPAVSGRLALREGGEIRLGNNVYTIEAGAVDFVDPTTIRPELDITAETRVASYRVTLTLDGPVDGLTTSLQSEPPLAESDIVSLLLTGRTLDQVGAAPGAIARDQALGLAAGELLGTAGRSLGLDTLRIESAVGGSAFTTDSTLVAGETNPGSRLTVGKNVSDEVQVIVSQNLRESGLLTWIVSYLPRRNIEIRGVLDDESDRAYEFRHSVSLGNPPRPPGRTAARSARIDRTVVEVRFQGDLGVPESTLRDRLQLTPGTRFDFQAWLGDRDRVDAWYHEQGYLEAQLGARRIESTPDTVTLAYEVRRGPRTVLTIEGYALSGETLADMRTAWSTAVFDGVLLDALQDLARRELVRNAYLQAAIVPDIVERPDVSEKEIRLDIRPGPQYAIRRLAYAGNRQRSDAELTAHLETRGLTDELWTRPAAAETALTTYYASLGFLDAAVTVGTPSFEEDTATLPITVAENAPYRIGSVLADGMTAFDSTVTLREAGFFVGAPYTDVAAQRARAELLLRYRRAGYTAAQVTVRSNVDRPEGTVAIDLQIAEGPRQIVEEVEITGRGRTRPELVSRALQIEPGQPVDLGEWNQARKRLYDTGAFRSVDIEAQPLAPPADVIDTATTQRVRARVVLEEWPALRLRYGLQLKDAQTAVDERGRDFNLGVVGDLTHQNFLGRAATIGTSFRYDTVQRALRGYLRFRTFFGLPLTTNVFASRRRETVGDAPFGFIDDTSRLTLEQRVPVGSNLTVAYSYNLSRTTNELIVPDPQFTEAPFWIARLNVSAVVDTRDDVFDATRGWFHSSTIEYAPAALGSDLRFVKYSAQQYYYRPVGRGLVLASAARLGMATGLAGDLLISSERFFAGGSNTVRGYARDGLGPFFGGRSLLVLNQEVRFPLGWVLRGVGFLDAGNAFPGVRDLSLFDLELGLGAGLRADTPFGLLRIDAGFPVSADGNRDVRWYIAVGQAF